MRPKIERLFDNTVTAYGKYSVLVTEYLTHPIHMHLSQNQKTSSKIFSAFPKFKLNFQHIKKERNTLMASAFLKLRTSKNVVT